MIDATRLTKENCPHRIHNGFFLESRYYQASNQSTDGFERKQDTEKIIAKMKKMHQEGTHFTLAILLDQSIPGVNFSKLWKVATGESWSYTGNTIRNIRRKAKKALTHKT